LRSGNDHAVEGITMLQRQRPGDRGVLEADWQLEELGSRISSRSVPGASNLPARRLIAISHTLAELT